MTTARSFLVDSSHVAARLLQPFAWGVLVWAFCCGCGDRSAVRVTPDPSKPAVADEQASSSIAKQTNLDSPEVSLRERIDQLENDDQSPAAKQLLTQQLIVDPNDMQANYLMARLQFNQGNAEQALAITERFSASDSAATIEFLELRIMILKRLDRYSDAADAIQQIIAQHTEQNATLRERLLHELWATLCRCGRRQEASEIAIRMARAGRATRDELISLIRRDESFPSPRLLTRNDGSRDERSHSNLFSPGLGLARWYFDDGQYQAALKQLRLPNGQGNQTPDARAFKGRILAKLQATDRLASWLINHREALHTREDFWIALTEYWKQKGKFESAAHAALQGLQINPTNREMVQHASGLMYALQRREDGDYFKSFGIDLANTETAATIVFLGESNLQQSLQTLLQRLVELGRPFETLNWKKLTIPPSQPGLLQHLEAQRVSLLKNPNALAMSAEYARQDIPIDTFSDQADWQQLVTATGPTTPAVNDQAASKQANVAFVPHLVDRAKQVGLTHEYLFSDRRDFEQIALYEAMGGGVGVLDFDRDGWADVYLAQGATDPPDQLASVSSQLFRNLSGKFAPVTENSLAGDFQFSTGIACGDVNQDGFPDLYLAALGKNRMLINNGDGTFRDATDQFEPSADQFSTSLAIADLNGDALPDLFEGNYFEIEGAFQRPKKNAQGQFTPPSPLTHFAGNDRWFANLGDGSWKTHTISSDVARPGTSLGVVITDFDGSGSNEVFVGNDMRANHFLKVAPSDQHTETLQSSDSKGVTFVNQADFLGLAMGTLGVPNGCMGIATGDFNRDGRFDLQIANYSQEPCNLFLQNAEGSFSDLAMRRGMHHPTNPMVGFGTKSVDLDRNGFLDFVVTNGHIFDMRYSGEPFKMPPQMFMGTGIDYQSLFPTDSENDSSDQPKQAEHAYWQHDYLGRAMATLDYDHDGALDFLVTHLDHPTALLHNESFTGEPERIAAGKRWLQIELTGIRSERDAIGAKVSVSYAGQVFTNWVTAGDGYFCTDEPVLSFAFPAIKSKQLPSVNVTIHWPSGSKQRLKTMELGHRYLVLEGQPDTFKLQP